MSAQQTGVSTTDRYRHSRQVSAQQTGISTADRCLHNRLVSAQQTGVSTTDRLARVGGQPDKEDRYTSYTDEMTIIKTLNKNKWKQQHQHFNQSDSLHKLNRPEQSVFCSGRELGTTDLMPTCTESSRLVSVSCNADIMTAEHLLQHCQLHDALRQDM